MKNICVQYCEESFLPLHYNITKRTTEAFIIMKLVKFYYYFNVVNSLMLYDLRRISDNNAVRELLEAFRISEREICVRELFYM